MVNEALKLLIGSVLSGIGEGEIPTASILCPKNILQLPQKTFYWAYDNTIIAKSFENCFKVLNRFLKDGLATSTSSMYTKQKFKLCRMRFMNL